LAKWTIAENIDPGPFYLQDQTLDIIMNYHDGSTVRLGDVVKVPIPKGTGRARVVMLGDTYEHLEIDSQFISWVKTDKMLKADSIVIEWLEDNPFAHDDSQYAPVGQYMFSALDEWVERDV